MVLEAGCGSGKFSLSFALLGHSVTALDVSRGILSNVEAAKKELMKSLDANLRIILSLRDSAEGFSANVKVGKGG